MKSNHLQDDVTRDQLTLVQGVSVNQYRIVQKIGMGGMGEVYLAEDTTLKRKVVLKFPLPSHSADGRQKARFLHEAEATARLNHPNVVTIYEIGQCQDRPYIATEYVEGESLWKHCQRQPLELVQVIDLAREICDALACAHEKGIIHRDIKPSNIMIDARGHAKVLDFGLAMMTGSEQLTSHGSLVGTIRYMSPEQVKGETLDARTDLYSLGVMLYELITGHVPYPQLNEAALLHAIVNQVPEPISKHRPDVPRLFEQIVMRLLEKERALRFESALEVSSALKGLRGSSASMPSPLLQPKNSILVLPFENLSADREDEYFSNGLTEEIITDLGKIGGITVISRKSSMQLKGTQKDLPTLGREFSVQQVLTGSVRRAHNNIRVNVELVEACNERQVWAERYSGTLEDVFTIQEQIARSIASAMQLKLTASDVSKLARQGIRQVKAYDLYLRARQESSAWTCEGLDQAHLFLEEALRLEPESAALHAALGYNYYHYVNLGFHQEASIAKALACVRKARELDPQSVDAMRLQGVIQASLTQEAREGLRLLLKVLEVAPLDTEAMLWTTLCAGFRGKSALAVHWANRLVEVEPFVHLNESFQAWARFLHGNFEDAIRIIRNVYQHLPDYTLVQFGYTLIHAYTGHISEAMACVSSMERRQQLSIFDRLVMAVVYAVQGLRDKVDAVLTEECKLSARRDMQYPWHISTVKALLGEKEEAMQWIELAVDNGFANYRFLEELDPFLAPLRSDSRFSKLVERARKEAVLD